MTSDLRGKSLFALGAVLAALAASNVAAVQLRPAALAGYERYVRLTEQRIAAERSGGSPLLWIDRQPEGARTQAMDRLRRGEVVVESVETRDAGRRIDISGGLVHHWMGTVLMPGVPLDRAVAYVQDYDRYPQRFSPMIQRVRVVAHEGDHFVLAMRTFVKKVVTVVMDGDYVVNYERLGPRRIAMTTVATKLYQVHEPGEPDESREAGDLASGYLWRFRLYCVFDERPEGSVKQCESISLTRGVPFAMSWLIKPFISGIPRESLAFTLRMVREGLVR